MSIFDKLLLKTTRFAKLAEVELAQEEVEPPTVREPGIPSNHKAFFEGLERLVGRPISVKDYSNWLKSNESLNVYNKSLAATIPFYNWDIDHPHTGPFLEAILGPESGSHQALRIFNKPIRAADIQQSILIPGVGAIPRLYAYVGVFTESPISQNVDSELGHNFFIWEAFQGMWKLESYPRELLRVASFVRENKAIINGLRNSFTGKPKYLRAGSDGAAFDVGNFILKIFRDPTAYKAAIEAKRKLDSKLDLAKTEAVIYDVGVLGSFNGQNVYYYLMEKMIAVENLGFPLEEALRKLVRTIALSLLQNTETLKDLKSKMSGLTSEQLQKNVSHIVDITFAQLNKSVLVSKVEEESEALIEKKTVPPLNKNWLRLLIEEVCYKFLTDRIDLHMGNIGITVQEGKWGEFRYFDPAFGGSSKFKGKKIHIGQQEFVPYVNETPQGEEEEEENQQTY